MGALVSGLLELLQWLSATARGFFEWLASHLFEVVTWVAVLFQAVINLVWNLVVDILGWFLAVLVWALGGLVELALAALTVLIFLLPSMPELGSAGPWNLLIPAFNVANQILPISEAIWLGTLWLTFYGTMALWRVLTFIRGGR